MDDNAQNLFDKHILDLPEGEAAAERVAREVAFHELLERNPDLADELTLLQKDYERIRGGQGGQALGTTEGGSPLHRPLSPTEGPPVSTFRAAEGATIGEFRLIRLLGRGGMGEVWEATQASLSRRVALKLMLSDCVDDKGLAFFAREARAGGRLAHPGIVSVYGAGEDEGKHWIAMELVEGACDLRRSLESLREEGEQQQGFYRHVPEFIAELADALEAAHAAGVIHRDLKPGNIMVTREDQPKLSDFGLAKLAGERSISHAGQMLGTCYYMSPEQVATKRAGFDHRTDIFSLGVVMYEMLTLVRPFQGDTTEQVAQKILWDDPPDPRTIRSRVPRELAVICAKALEKDPARRYQSMAEFAADLRRHLAHETIRAKPPTALHRAAKWVRRNPTKSAAGGVVAVALLAITGMWWRAMDAERETGLERDRAQAAEIKAKESAGRALSAEGEALEHLLASVLAEKKANRQAYSGNFHAARAAFEGGRFQEARRRLAACPMELRDWEWFHLDLSLDQSLQTLRGHEDTVFSVAWSPSGNKFVSGSDDHTLRIWDAETGECLRTLVGHKSTVSSVDWSPSGKRIASGSSDSTIRIWDAETGACEEILKGQAGVVSRGVASVAWNSTGSQLVSVAFGSSIHIWDAETGELLRTLDQPGSRDLGRTVAWGPSDTVIICGYNDATVKRWDLATGRPRRGFTGRGTSMLLEASLQGDMVTSVSWDPTGTKFVCGSYDGRLSILDGETLEALLTLEGHEGRVLSVDWSPTGTRIVSASDDATVRIWDPKTGENVQTMWGHENSVTAVAWSPSGPRILSGSSDKTLRVWEVTTGTNPHNLRAQSEDPMEVLSPVSWDPTGAWLLSGHETGELHIWGAATGERSMTLSGHEESVRAVDWSPSGSQLVSGSADRTLRIWNAVTGESSRVLEGHENQVAAVAWSPDGKSLVSGSWDKTLRIWNPETGECRGALEGHDAAVRCVAWSADGETIASGSNDRSVRIWDGATGETLRVLGGHSAPVLCLAWNPSGGQIVSGSGDMAEHRLGNDHAASLHVWDATTGERLYDLPGHRHAVLSVAWSPRGTRIASVSGSLLGMSRGSMSSPEKAFSLRVWDVGTAEGLLVLEEESMCSVAWSPSGTRIAAMSAGETIKMWESQMNEAVSYWRAEGRR